MIVVSASGIPATIVTPGDCRFWALQNEVVQESLPVMVDVNKLTVESMSAFEG
jgi:hypothetical protein